MPQETIARKEVAIQVERTEHWADEQRDLVVWDWNLGPGQRVSNCGQGEYWGIGQEC